MNRLEEVEVKYGTRPRIPMGHGEPLLEKHCRGELSSGERFVWCPFGYLISWHPGDYDNRWCAWCQKFFGDGEA